MVVRVHTDDGIIGIGEAPGTSMPFPGIYQQKEDGTLEAAGASRIVVDVLKLFWWGRTRRTPNDFGR